VTQSMKARPLDVMHCQVKRLPGHAPDEFDPATRLAWVKVTLVLAFTADLVFSWKLWLSSRSYPLAPLWDALPPIRFPLDYVCLSAFFVLLAAILWTERPRPWLTGLVLLVTVYSLWDQARWTPPVYQYTFMLAALAFYPWSRLDAGRGRAVLNACRVIIAGTYLWAGLQKVNITFIRQGFPWMLEPLVGKLSDPFRGLPLPLGLGAALIEAGIGLGLVFRPTRQIAVLAALGLHGFILFSIGPLGHWWDMNVWPWNLATPVLVALLFWRIDEVGAREILVPRELHFQWVAVLLFVFMPALNFVGFWDDYLSAAIYSDNVRSGAIRMTAETKAALPNEIRRHVQRSPYGDELDLMRWAFADRNIEPYPESRVFKATARELCRYSDGPEGMTLMIFQKPHWRTGRRTTNRYTCGDLGGTQQIPPAGGKAGFTRR
jgi:hypothetical protein